MPWNIETIEAILVMEKQLDDLKKKGLITPEQQTEYLNDLHDEALAELEKIKAPPP